MSINPEGYLAMITPACWYWNLASLGALISFGYLYGIREIRELESAFDAYE